MKIEGWLKIARRVVAGDNGMIDSMKRHEFYVKEELAKNLPPEALGELLAYHDKRIGWMQHERLAHLLVTLFVCLFALLSLGYALIYPSVWCFLLSGLLIILSAAYLLHYYRLENGVQKWYSLSDDIRRQARQG